MASFDFKSLNSDVLWLAFAFGLAGVQRLWRGYQERRAQTWPMAYGRIDRVSLDTEHKKVTLKCYYTYRVEQESFVGSFKRTFEDPDEAEVWQDALQKKQIAAHYDPRNPSRSQLRESDLEPIVRSAAPVRPFHTATASSGKLVLAAKLCSVVCALGLAITLMVLLEKYIGKDLVTPYLASVAEWAALPVFFLGLWIGGRDKLAARIPGWMKFLSYALFYYALFSSFLAPARPSRDRIRQSFDARYQLFLYFSALECCYLRLHQKERTAQEYGALAGSSLK